ncbi:MAG: hypothetical protein R3F07_17040 [Opitutaceae bacterium]
MPGKPKSQLLRVVGVIATLFLSPGCVLVPLDSLRSDFELEGMFPEDLTFIFEELLEEPNSARPPRPNPSSDEEIGQYRVTEVIVIGNTSAYRELKGKGLDRAFREYQGFAHQLHPGRSPIYNLETFSTEYSGWTRLKILSVPTVVGKYETVIVPRRFRSAIAYSHPIGTALVQGTGDLVAARTTEEGVLAIVEQLCPEDSNYGDCSDCYRRGIFDGKTGVELNEDLTPRKPTNRIDPRTYRLIREESEDVGN